MPPLALPRALADVLLASVPVPESAEVARAGGAGAVAVSDLFPDGDPAKADPGALRAHVAACLARVAATAAEPHAYAKLMGVGPYKSADACVHNAEIHWALSYPHAGAIATSSALQEMHVVLWALGVALLARPAGPRAPAALTDAACAFDWCERLAAAPPQREYGPRDPLHMRLPMCRGAKRLAQAARAMARAAEAAGSGGLTAGAHAAVASAVAHAGAALASFENAAASDDGGVDLLAAVREYRDYCARWADVCAAAAHACRGPEQARAALARLDRAAGAFEGEDRAVVAREQAEAERRAGGAAPFALRFVGAAVAGLVGAADADIPPLAGAGVGGVGGGGAGEGEPPSWLRLLATVSRT